MSKKKLGFVCILPIFFGLVIRGGAVILYLLVSGLVGLYCGHFSFLLFFHGNITIFPSPGLLRLLLLVAVVAVVDSLPPSMATTTSFGGLVVSLPDIEGALGRIRELGLQETPVATSETMNRLSGHELFFKCELFQKTGSFKARGATNACALLPSGQAVVTHSSGNHAQAIAFAAKTTGRQATIVMPRTAPLPKQAATRGYGAAVTLCEPTNAARAAGAAAAAEATGGAIVHPSEDPFVIAGQGTVALELLSQVAKMRGGDGDSGAVDNDATSSEDRDPPIDVLVVPIGGGGLASGCATACKALWANKVLVIGAEPAAMDDAFRSKQAGQLLGNDSKPPLATADTKGTLRSNEPGGQPAKAPMTTVADGLRTQLGPNTWPVVREHVDHILTVEEEDILSATKLVWSRMKLQIEPSAGVGVAVALSSPFRDLLSSWQRERSQSGLSTEEEAALKKRKIADESGSEKLRVGIVLCGGNADPVQLAPLLDSAPPYPKGALV